MTITVADRRELTHLGRYFRSNIEATFRSRPACQAAFVETWRLLMWASPAQRRPLREAVAVAVSAANACAY